MYKGQASYRSSQSLYYLDMFMGITLLINMIWINGRLFKNSTVETLICMFLWLCTIYPLFFWFFKRPPIFLYSYTIKEHNLKLILAWVPNATKKFVDMFLFLVNLLLYVLKLIFSLVSHLTRFKPFTVLLKCLATILNLDLITFSTRPILKLWHIGVFSPFAHAISWQWYIN